VNYRGFADDVTVGNTILVDNALIKLLVLDKGTIVCAAGFDTCDPSRFAAATLICPAYT